MSRTRTPGAGVSIPPVLALAAILVGLPVAAADSPEAAVDQLVEIVTGGDYAALDQVVCEAEFDAVIEQFDIAASLGIPADEGATTDALAFRIAGAATEVIEQADETARVRLTGTLSIEVDEDRIRDLVRQMLEAQGASFDEQELDDMSDGFLNLFSQSQPLDEEIELVLEDGGWLVCGGLGTGSEDPASVEPSVSFEGLCGLVPIADINSVGEPDVLFDSSDGTDEHCTFSTSTFDEDYRTLTISFARSGNIDEYRAFFPDGTDLTVAGRPAYAPGDQLLVEVEGGLFQASVYLGEDLPEAIDRVEYLTAISELFVPVLPEIIEASASDQGTDEANAEAEASFCDVVSMEALSELTGLSFDEASGGPTFCAYSSSQPESFYLVSTSLEQLSLDDLKLFLPDGEDLTVAGSPAYSIEGGQLWVGIPDTDSTLNVAAFVDASLGGEGVGSGEVAVGMAELVLLAVLAQQGDDAGEG